MSHRANRVHATVDSPLGPVTLVAADGGLAGLYLDTQRHPPTADELGDEDVTSSCLEDGNGTSSPNVAVLAEAARQLTAYFDGRLTEFDVPLALAGTPFQQAVWAALQRVPYGETVSYRELAEQIGRPTAARAVGMANGRNPVAIIVPCHRVVGTGGGLVGYGGGVDRKRRLLEFERGGTSLFGSRTGTFGN